MKTVENIAAKIEQAMNPIDWIPIAASFSGMVRILAGIVQVAAGLAFAALKCFYIILTGQGRYGQALEQGANFSKHGFFNIARGVVAMLPFVNMSLYIYDKYIGRMNYEVEHEKLAAHGPYPILTAHTVLRTRPRWS